MDHVDKPLAVTIEAANRETFRTWCELFRAENLPTKRRRGTTADITEWLLKTPEALWHLYAFLPYPEQEAKTWRMEPLIVWVLLEAQRELVNALRRLVDDPTIVEAGRRYCKEWIEEYSNDL
ncbi:hypothetical protein GN244_ATG01591 [Phytophthora infestans]|nr:hypothetical protein GN244_ATG01591 [Phytophthora infestans]